MRLSAPRTLRATVAPQARERAQGILRAPRRRLETRPQVLTEEATRRRRTTQRAYRGNDISLQGRHTYRRHGRALKYSRLLQGMLTVPRNTYCCSCGK